MNTIAQSFAYLVNSNNGLFKSSQQANLMLSQTDNGVFVASGNFHGASWTKFYVCDEKGIVKVIHHTKMKGDVLEWERRQEGVKTVQDSKEEKRINREIKALEKRIKETEEAWLRGEYVGSEDLYKGTMEWVNMMLNKYKSML